MQFGGYFLPIKIIEDEKFSSFTDSNNFSTNNNTKNLDMDKTEIQTNVILEKDSSLKYWWFIFLVYIVYKIMK
jgi:hypothetical protein